jgi:hypothetical protein
MSDDEYDKILFDGNPISGHNQNLLKYYENYKLFNSNLEEYNKLEIISSEIQNKLYFELGIYQFDAGCSNSTKTFIFKEYIVIMDQNGAGSFDNQFGNVRINVIKHNIPTHILCAIKYFQYDKIYHSIAQSFDIYNTHPEYFMSNIEKNISEKLETIQNDKELIKVKNDELDKLISDNKKIIKEKQNELDKLILENQQKIDYYASLEQQIIDIQKEKEFIKEDKRKISIAKDKLSQQKRELDDNKFKFELEKDRINDFDIDKFITQKNI